jgi:hypothetical protein
MKYLIAFALLVVSVIAQAGEFTVMGGVSMFRPPDSGTYWNNNQAYDNFMTPAAVGLRYDTTTSGSISYGVQYTHFGEVKMDALAVSAEPPTIGGYDPSTGSCVGGTCAPLRRWRMHSDTQSIALIATKHYGNWSVEGGINVYEVKTGGNVPDLNYQYPDARFLYATPMFGGAYRSGPWSIRAQVWIMPTTGETPAAFHEKGAATVMVGYTFQ